MLYLKKNRNVTVIIYMLGLYCLLLGNSHAQEGFNLQLEPMYMGVTGANTNLAKIQSTSNFSNSSNSSYTTTTTSSTSNSYTYNSTSVTSSVTTNSTGYSSASKNFDMSGNGTFRGQLEYMHEGWGGGISGWWFDTSSSINMNLNSPPSPTYLSGTYPPVTANPSISYSSSNLNFSAPPVNSGGLLKTSAQNNLNVWNLDAYGMKSIGDFENGGINLTIGAKFGGINSNLSESVVQTPSTLNGSYYPNSTWSQTSSGYGSATNSAKANFLVGPSFGLQGLGKFGNHRLEGFVSQSFLIGNVNHSTSSASLTSNQIKTNYYYGGTNYSYTYNNNYINTYNNNNYRNLSDSDTVVIPVTEFKIKYLYDITDNLSLGAGFFGSVWVDTPMISSGSNNRPTKTLFFYGGLASINFRY